MVATGKPTVLREKRTVAIIVKFRFVSATIVCLIVDFATACADFVCPRGGAKFAVAKRGQVAQVVERSPEKAGVGGSTPSLATIIPKNLAAESRNFQPTIQPMILTELAP